MVLAAALIEVRGAAFNYGERNIFQALDLDVYPGEVVTILGPNGCGKSTLLRCIGGVLDLAQGSVQIGKVDLATLGPSARAKKIAVLFQDHTPTFPFTVLDVALMGRTPYFGMFGSPSPQDVVIAEAALESVGMLRARNRPYTELSGGERQLVLLSRTLAQQPEVILLDEPTSHLDMKNQVLCLQCVGALAGQGRAMVMTTHDPNHAFLFPGRVVLMKPGGSIIAGAASEVLTEAALSMIYETRIRVFSSPDAAGKQAMHCSPW